MSWNTARKRFQRDIDKYPKALRDVYLKNSNKYTLPSFESELYPVPEKERQTAIDDIGFANGDLGYIHQGTRKGTVSTIFQYSPQMDAFLMADITSKKILPKQHWVENQTSHLIDYPDYVRREDVKLAAKDKDESGKVYHVVANDVVFKGTYYDERYKRWMPKRFVKGHEKIEIPWPNPTQEPKDDYLSTKGPTVFEKSYELQSLVRPPVPREALSQLRNPYSKFKKRYLTESQAYKVNAPEMPLSDAQKIYMARKASEPKKTYKGLTEEMQDFIGSKIADHVNKIDNPALLAHLDALSKMKIPDFEKTMSMVRQSEQQEEPQENKPN